MQQNSYIDCIGGSIHQNTPELSALNHMVQSPWLKSDPQQNLHQIALNNMNNSLLQPSLLNGLPQRYVRVA